MPTRTEEDSLGTVELPQDAYYGAFTQRAVENFDLTGETVDPVLVHALGAVKEAAARSNRDLGLLEEETAEAIIDAAQEVQEGEFDDAFVLDPIQAGAGTPVHMNANEVIANRATELLGGDLGEYRVHPNDDVNMGQSSNNVVPTAARLAALDRAAVLLEELEQLAAAFDDRADEAGDVVKVGRTHLQDAVPVTVAQEFEAYAEHCRRGRERLAAALDGLCEVGLGGNAVGTGINTPPEFREYVVAELADVTGHDLEPVDDPVAATQSMTPFVAVADALDGLTRDLSKVADDLMLLSSGPVAGLGEVQRPAVEPGSSIMPGKVNPSILEAFRMSCMQVQGNASVVRHAAEDGHLELNVNTPLIAYNLLDSFSLLANAVEMLRERCITGIDIDTDRIEDLFTRSTVTATALSPYLGYDRTADAVHTAVEEDRPVRDVVEERGWMTGAELDAVLDPERMTMPHSIDTDIQEDVAQRLENDG
ncbi:MAG: aspartate ammonia-lyase [Candidatus Nanohaloarchaea archaeon]|nr:aspartate ammonia-lyase [Candidatus Nanohaloarchaea archaeon]